MSKLFNHPTEGFVLETSSTKLHITNDEVKETSINTEGLEEVPADITVSATIDNALQAAKARKSADYIAGVQQLLQHMIENFE